MKHLSIIKLVFLLILISGTNCKKNPLSELDKLPPATQIGAKTFGCLINGKAWLPDNGCTLLCPSSLKFYYDNINGGQFSTRAELTVNGRSEYINFGLDSCNKTGSYIFSTGLSGRSFAYNDYKKLTCQTLFSNDTGTEINGYLNIARFDLQNGVISGTFEITLSRSGCETINITNGRFDAKL